MSPETLRLPEQIRLAIEAHASNCAPDECCGLLASDAEGRLRFAYPLTNVEASPISFTIDPDEHLHALLHAEAQGWEISGVFHSHPGGEGLPSARDLRAPHDPAWIHLIVATGRVRAFTYLEGRALELEVDLG